MVVVGYHLMLDGPHALRCVLSNIRRFMRSIYLKKKKKKKTGEQVALATQCPVYDLIINDPDIVHLVCGKYVCFALM